MHTNQIDNTVVYGYFGTVHPDQYSLSKEIAIRPNRNIIPYNPTYSTSDFSTRYFKGESYSLKIHKLLEPARRKFQMKHNIELEDQSYNDAIYTVLRNLSGYIHDCKALDGLKDEAINNVLESIAVKERKKVIDILEATFLKND